MQDEKQARTKRYRGDEKVQRGTRRVQSATQRHRALPSALRALTQRPQPPERPHGPDRTRSRGLPLGAGQPRSSGPGKPSTSEPTTWSPHTYRDITVIPSMGEAEGVRHLVPQSANEAHSRRGEATKGLEEKRNDGVALAEGISVVGRRGGDVAGVLARVEKPSLKEGYSTQCT